MKAKVRLIFNRRNNATERNAPNPVKGSVEIEITNNGARRRSATGVRVFLDQWQDGFVVNHIDAADINHFLRKKYEEACALAVEQGLGVYAISDLWESRGDVCDWIEKQIASRTDLASNTLRDHLRMVRYLRESGYFHKFSDLSERNINLWDLWLKQRLNKQSAVHGYHKRLKTYVSRAIKLGLLSESPYRFVKVPRGRSEEIKYLLPDERDRVASLPLEGTIAIARDMFIFACYTGLAYCDLIRVKEMLINTPGGWLIDGSRLKTNTHYKLTVLPRALEILERYNFNMDLLSNQKCNMYLKAIQAIAGIKTRMTMHVGRHTFATWALQMGVPLPVVSKMLAHTNIATTQIYAKVLQSEVAKGFDLLREE